MSQQAAEHFTTHVRLCPLPQTRLLQPNILASLAAFVGASTNAPSLRSLNRGFQAATERSLFTPASVDRFAYFDQWHYKTVDHQALTDAGVCDFTASRTPARASAVTPSPPRESAHLRF